MAGNNEYITNIELTVNGKKYKAGEKIGEKMNAADVKFLLRESYIREVKDNKDTAKSSEKKASQKESS